jgi:hypothetical protein
MEDSEKEKITYNNLFFFLGFGSSIKNIEDFSKYANGLLDN